MALSGTTTQTTTPNSAYTLPTGLFGQTVQNLAGFGDPYQMSSPQWAALGNLVGAATQPIPDPVTGNPAWQGYLQGQQNLQGLMGSFQAPQVGQVSPSSYGSVGGGISFSAPSVNFSPTAHSYDAVGVPGQAPVNTAQIDPAAAYAAAQRTLEQIATPQVRAALQAAGMGRSGAEGLGIAQAGAALELPIQQQVLASQAQANQLDASIKARQQETSMLATVQARLQAQQLTATSQQQYEQIGAQIAMVQAQIQENANAINAQIQMQAALQAQALSAQSQMQSNALNMQGQIANQGAAMQQYGTNMGAMTQGQNQLTSLTQAFPSMFNQNYLTGLTGASTALNALGQPQQLDIANLKNQQDFLIRLMGGMPGGATQTTTSDPGILGTAGSAALMAGLLGQSGLGSYLFGAPKPGGLFSNLFSSTPAPPSSFAIDPTFLYAQDPAASMFSEPSFPDPSTWGGYF